MKLLGLETIPNSSAIKTLSFGVLIVFVVALGTYHKRGLQFRLGSQLL